MAAISSASVARIIPPEELVIFPVEISKPSNFMVMLVDLTRPPKTVQLQNRGYV
jgi:hypothetical protein